MMFKFSTVAIVATTLSSILINSIVSGHMAMYNPAPRYSNYDSYAPQPPAGQTYDYNIKSPIGTSATINNPICKHTVPYDTPVATWTAGQTVTVDFQTGGAAHSGGHCQFSISYDGGKTFVVIKNVFSYCFFTGSAVDDNTATVLSYDVELPSGLPSGLAIFSWTWVNASGNREFYMNCADVKINGTGDSYTGQKMLIANYGSQYPAIPAFGGDYTTGLDLYNSQPQVTVYANGSSTTGTSTNSNSIQPVAATGNVSNSSDSYQSIPPTIPKEDNQSVSSADTYQAAPVAPAPAPAPAAPASNNTNYSTVSSGPDSCLSAAMRCSTSSNGFDVCNQGTWLFEPCAQGTVCVLTSNGFPECTWP